MQNAGCSVGKTQLVTQVTFICSKVTAKQCFEG